MIIFDCIILMLCFVRIIFALMFMGDGIFPARNAATEAWTIALYGALLVLAVVLLARGV